MILYFLDAKYEPLQSLEVLYNPERFDTDAYDTFFWMTNPTDRCHWRGAYQCLLEQKLAIWL